MALMIFFASPDVNPQTTPYSSEDYFSWVWNAEWSFITVSESSGIVSLNKLLIAIPRSESMDPKATSWSKSHDPNFPTSPLNLSILRKYFSSSAGRQDFSPSFFTAYPLVSIARIRSSARFTGTAIVDPVFSLFPSFTCLAFPRTTTSRSSLLRYHVNWI